MPDFKWTGDLRPARIGPMRPVRPAGSSITSRERGAWPVAAAWRDGYCVTRLLLLSVLPSSSQIPDHIPKPDYYATGYPASEMESRQQHQGESDLCFL